MKFKTPWNKPYLLIVANLFCNHQCTYCIQRKSSLDVRLNPHKINVLAVLRFLEKNRIDRSVKLMGGEATLHPDFETLVEGLLGLYKKLVITTNLNGKWYRDFDNALGKMKSWGPRMKWNTTYHPAWMDADLYVERIRRMRDSGLQVGQVATTDTADLKPQTAEVLDNAAIGWKLQTFTGRSPDGRLLPQTWDDVNLKYPQLYSPKKYIENYHDYAHECEDANYADNFYREEWVSCTSSKFLIGPDNNVYPCHRHLYVGDTSYACGSIHDSEMKGFKFRWNNVLKKWTLPCNTKCNPCDFKSVIIKSTGRINHAASAHRHRRKAS